MHDPSIIDSEKSFEEAEDRLANHLRNDAAFKAFPTIDFAATTFSAMQHCINSTNLTLDAADIDNLLGKIQALDFGGKPSLDHVSNALRDCVLGFLQEKVTRHPPVYGPVVRHVVKKAKDGVFRLFPEGHKFPDER